MCLVLQIFLIPWVMGLNFRQNSSLQNVNHSSLRGCHYELMEANQNRQRLHDFEHVLDWSWSLPQLSQYVCEYPASQTSVLVFSCLLC